MPGVILSIEWVCHGSAVLLVTAEHLYWFRDTLAELVLSREAISSAAVSCQRDANYLALFYKNGRTGKYMAEIFRCREEGGVYKPVFLAARETSSQEIFQITCAEWLENQCLVCGTQDGAVYRMDVSFENSEKERISLRRLGDKCTNSVRCSSWSYDGQKLATGCDDHWIRIWDTKSWKCTQILEGHDDSVKCLAWSPDDRYLVSGSDDRTLRIWDPVSGQSMIGSDHTTPVNCVCWIQNNQIISGSDDCKLIKWTLDGKLSGPLMLGHEKRIYGVAVSPDKKFLISGGNDKQIRVWDVALARELPDSPVDSCHQEPIRALAWSQDNAIFSVSNDKTIIMRRWKGSEEQIWVFPEKHTDFIYSIALSPNGLYAITGSTDTNVGFWDINTRNLLAMGTDHADFVWNISTGIQGSCGHFAASSSSDGTIKIWNVSQIPESSIRPFRSLEVIPCVNLIGCDFYGALMTNDALRQLLYSNGGIVHQEPS